MEPFEYVVVLTSLILGLGMAQLLTGIADMCSHYRAIKFSLPHTIYIFVVFILHINEWWVNYQYSKVVDSWTLQVVLSILVFPIILFIQARLLFPTGLRSEDTNMDKYFQDQWKWLYSLGAMTVAVSFWQNLIISDIPIMDQPQILGLFVVYIIFIISNTQNKLAHSIFLGLQLIGWIVYVIIEDNML